MSQATVQAFPNTGQSAMPPVQQEMTPLTVGEVKITGPAELLDRSPGFAKHTGEAVDMLTVKPENNSYGFSKNGRFIGANPVYPYPFANPHYHQEHLPTGFDWSRHQAIGSQISTNPGDSETDTSAEIAEYFTAENDDGYNRWLARKDKEKQDRKEKQEALKVVPQEIKALPGHAGPSKTETTNDMYGKFNDLVPSLPLVYPLRTHVARPAVKVLVKFTKSNMSDYPPIPDHSFAVEPREMLSHEGYYSRGFNGAVYYPEVTGVTQKTPYTFQTATMNLGEKVGERKRGLTFPMLAPTGLELNRPIQSRCVSVLTTCPNVTEAKQVYVPAKSVPQIYGRYMTHSSHPGGDEEMEVNPAKKTIRLTCAPYSLHPPAGPGRNVHQNPCHVKYVGPPFLPVPLCARKPPHC